jgi:NAD-dependent SIR2 family protein deacetylase
MLQVAINKIILSLYNIDVNWITHHEYNFVPFNENTPTRISYVLNGIILNFASNNIIDNTFTNCKIELSKYHGKLSSFECSICYNTIEEKDCASFECKHEYCIDCIEQLVKKKHTSCPYCREEIKNITCHSDESYHKLNKLINSL